MNWGRGIAVALTLFIGFIVTLVSIIMSQKVDLESENYYADEQVYQQEIDAISAGNQQADFTFKVKDNLFWVYVPDSISPEVIFVEFYRPNDQNEDRKFEIKNTKNFSIPAHFFQKGIYDIQLKYTLNEKEFIQKYSFTF